MFQPQDIRLAREVDGIDLILGGHDHHYIHSVESDITILKSGSEFREFSIIDVSMRNKNVTFDIKRHQIPAKSDIDPKMEEIVNHYMGESRALRAVPVIKLQT